MDGLNTVAFSLWNKTATSLLHNLLTDSNGVVISLHLSICLLIRGRRSSAMVSVAVAVMILSSATCALVASMGETVLWSVPM